MILGFLAVERKGVVLALLRQGDGNRRNQRDALVGRAEQHVELDAACRSGFRVESGESAKGVTVVEEPGVEEIG